MTRPATTADHWLVRAVMREAGAAGSPVSEAEAARAVELVTAGIGGDLRLGRSAKLHGIGELKPGKWREPQPASRGADGFREVSYRHPIIVNTRPVQERDCGALLTADDRRRIRQGATASGLGKPQGPAS